MNGLSKKIFLYAIPAFFAISSSAFASGFRLEFESASVLADAGGAAVNEDASANWYNPAGLVYLPQQFVGSLIDVYPQTQFSGTQIAPSASGVAANTFV